jgi:ribokinase
MNPPRIVVVGSSNIDMVVPVPHIPAPGETVLGGEFQMVPGGKGANQAVAAARLGAQVTLVARLGEDVFAAPSLENFAAAGIDTTHVKRDPQAASGVALIFVGAGGENSIAVAPGANARLSPEDVDAAEEAIAGADVLLLQLEVPLATVERAVALAKRHGRRVLLNPAPAQPVPDDLLTRVDLLTPNETEARVLLGGSPGADDPAAAAMALLRRGAAAVVVTLGARGALLVTPDGRAEIPPRPVTAVDTTAAGDTFSAALAVAWAEGRPLPDAAAFAAAAAALSGPRRGAQTSIPTRAEVDAFV